MGTNSENCKNNRTNIESVLRESDAVWDQLLRLAEDGDIRAIKLYYEMLEKKQQAQTTGGTDRKAETEIESMAAIRRAVFGDAAMTAAAASAMTANAAAHRDRTAAVTEDGLDGDEDGL